jgi:hypothetical protein
MRASGAGVNKALSQLRQLLMNINQFPEVQSGPVDYSWTAQIIGRVSAAELKSDEDFD